MVAIHNGSILSETFKPARARSSTCNGPGSGDRFHQRIDIERLGRKDDVFGKRRREGNGLLVFDQTLDVQLDRSYIRRSVSSRVAPVATQPGGFSEYAEKLLPALSMTIRKRCIFIL